MVNDDGKFIFELILLALGSGLYILFQVGDFGDYFIVCSAIVIVVIWILYKIFKR